MDNSPPNFEVLSPNLSNRCKEVVRLRFERSMTQGEIATTLGITQQMVWKYLKRARLEHPNLPRLISSGRHNRGAVVA